ncbi:hypothetical protein DFH27DRAFT_484731 [Peziza echinospora]|nr:hypothetical protein DFH27DRAFT_484731 [Peziza echinospora]
MSRLATWQENTISALAPLGILTAIVGAIRLGGPSWLKAVVGRARENRATVELELMSSTSHELCELWNGLGVVRTMGRPQITEIIYFESLKDTETFGLYTLESALKAGNLYAAPDISLNLHPGNNQRELYTCAILGILSQVGILAFIGFATYVSSPRYKRTEPIEAWAFPTMTTGTFLLTLGMIMCDSIVENSSTEVEFVPSIPENEMRMLWLQKSHVVSDQTFDSYVMFAKGRLKRILSSRRKDVQRKSPMPTDMDLQLRQSCGLVGFVLQFQALRGLHWSASNAQLLGLAIMTLRRAWIRRGLTSTPVSRKLINDHELDWLTLWLAADGTPGDGNGWDKVDSESCEPASSASSKVILPQITKERLCLHGS